MERQTQQLITLVDDLLEVSRITQGKLKLRKQSVKLADVVCSAVEAAKPGIDAARHILQTSLPEHDIVLDADPNRLAQVISNLLNNAVKYTPEGGMIFLSIARQSQDVIIAVKDNGIGIPAGMQGRIFDMFAQINRPMHRGDSGLGFGLTLTKSLVEMHGGKICVHSAGTNQGSEFRVHLPVHNELPIHTPPADDGDANLPNNAHCRVLVVGDNRAAADMLSRVVKIFGYEVRTACLGSSASGISYCLN